MSGTSDHSFFEELYSEFPSPLSTIDCGLKCGPYNDYGVPVCCDIQLTIPAAFEAEWEYLQKRTDLWRVWSSNDSFSSLEDGLQDGQVLLQCLGHKKCQREYRTLTCRAFPFFPYLDSRGEFTGMGYYRDYRESCWVISNLAVVTKGFRSEFRRAYIKVFEKYPDVKENFHRYADYIREETKQDQWITVLDFEGGVRLIHPETEMSRQIDYPDLPAYSVFAIGKELQFPDEDQV